MKKRKVKAMSKEAENRPRPQGIEKADWRLRQRVPQRASSGPLEREGQRAPFLTITDARARARVALLSLALLAACGIVNAQSSGTGAIAARILDPSSSVVTNATITLINDETGASRTLRSSPDGVYRATLLPPGHYSLRVDASGFEPVSLHSIHVLVTETTAVDIPLRIGTTAARVDVSAAPRFVQTESSALGWATDADAITGLPLANRNFTQILALSPGVTVELPDAGALGRNNQNVAADGAKTTDNNFQFNGIDANNISENSATGFGAEVGVAIPAPDTIAEFKVQTGLYDAAYGRSAGANVDLVSRGGTNGFHGNVWEFFRNDALNANDFFLNQNGQPRPVLKQNQFGFTLGGPIRRNKTFFFASYQGTIQRNGESSLSLQSAFLPALTNDRSAAALGNLFGGQTGAFGGAAVAPDGSNINPAALALLNFKFPDGSFAIPSPQTILPGGIGESTFSSPARFHEDQFTLNLDHAVTARNEASVRFFFSQDHEATPFASFGATLPGWGQNETDKNAMLVLSDTHTFNARLVNSARFGYVRFNGAQVGQSPIRAADVGITSPTGLPQIPAISIAGLFMIGSNGSPFFFETTNTFVGQDTLSYLFGKHSLRAGFEAKRTQLNVNAPFVTDGFTFYLSFPDFLLGETAAQNGSPVSNVFLVSGASGLFPKAERYTDLAGFIQDDYKLTSRFTLNAGLRYEFFGPPSDIHGQLPNFDPALADPNPSSSGTLTGLVLASNYHGPLPAGVTQTGETGLWQKDFKDFAPRVGFAWQLHDQPDLVLRGGYGIYYQRLSGQLALDTIGAAPFALQVLRSGASNADSSLQVPFDPALPPPSSFPVFVPRAPDSSIFFPSISRSIRSPYLQEYGLDVQYSPTRDLLWDIGYVGSYGSRLTGCLQFNQAELASPDNPVRGETTNTLENVAQRVPILGVGGGSFQCQTVFHSNYNALQTSVRKRLSHGMNLLASYTYSKSLDVTSGGGNASPFDLSFITNDQTDPNNAYGPSDFDRTHRFVLSFVQRAPDLRTGPRVARQALSGWQFSGILVLQSGLPITPVDSTAGTVFGNSVSEVRANCTGADPAGSGSVTSRLNGYFNPAAFAPPPAIGDGTGFGSCGTGIVRGPDQRNLDLGVQRGFRVTERSNIEFRAEFFNLTNTPKFGLPVRDFSSPSFGVISNSVSNPRIVQLALKFNF
ncbi:MAG TPA: TonB-dependent receptor [Candidatus Acidoferrales bacterium]|nr:TonB-dependent receptor [Candidatus Acidoferrales bacterium]